jgi:diaminopimelate decarboxylase
MAMPGAPFLHREKGQLMLEGQNLTELARQHGTPLFVYSRNAMLSAAASYQRALAGRPHLLCYAMKANSNLSVLQTLAEAGLGFDIVSAGELHRVLKAGGKAKRCVFSGVGKTRAEMTLALEAGVRCFNVESEAELRVLSAVAESRSKRAPVSLRVNPDVDAGTHPYISTGLKGNKFGIAHREALAVYTLAASLPGLDVTGIDCHIGSQITTSEPYIDALDRLLDLVEALDQTGIAIRHIDLGGGLGITYTDETPPSPENLVGQMLARIDERGHGHREILLEPGRSLVGNAGVLLTEVLYLKPGETKNFCIVDAAMNDMLRPAMYEAWMAILPCQESTSSTPEASALWDVVGPVCESGDWLGHDRRLKVAQGDFLAVLSSGAYGMTMSSNYNSRPRAAEVLVDGGGARLIRERETLEHLVAGEHLP